MINKVTSIDDAISHVADGNTILVGGFSSVGTPHNLVEAVSEKRLKGLTIVTNAPAQLLLWKEPESVVKIITSQAIYPFKNWRFGPVTEAVGRGAIECEVVPQGTMTERIRAAGCGIPAFYTPVGVGTLMEKGHQKAVFDGREYLLERALHADVALIKGDKADRMGNVVYRMAQRNFNPLMATAARVTIVEVDEVVEVGQLDPQHIVTPGIYVDWVVQVPKRIIGYQ